MKFILFVISFLFVPELLSAQATGLQFLNIGPSAASLGSAEARTATLSGSSSIYFNPALLALEPTSSLDLTYGQWIGDQNNIHGGINLRNHNKQRAIALAFYSVQTGGIEQRDNPGPSNGSFEVRNASISGALAYDLNLFSVGIAGQFLSEDYFVEQASGYAFNFGLARSFLNKRLRIGASLLNIGEMDELDIERTPLPENFRAGIYHEFRKFAAPGRNDFGFKLALHADYVYMLDEFDGSGLLDQTAFSNSRDFFNLAGSLTVAETILLQTGYKTGDQERPVSFGAGILLDTLEFNYALVPFNSGFGTAHSIGIRYLF